MAKKCNIEGPAGYNGGKGPGGAVNLPTKTYASSHLDKSGKPTKIDSPAKK